MALSEQEKRAIAQMVRLTFIEKPDVSLTKTFLAHLSNDKWLALVDDKKKVGEAKVYANEVLKGLASGGTQELSRLGIDAIASGSEKHAPPGYRALDGIARLIAKIWPKETCVAVCVEPRYQRSLLVSSNGRGLDGTAVQHLLDEVAKSTTSFGSQEQLALSELSAMRGSLSFQQRTTYVELRARRDTAKLSTAVNNILRSLRVQMVTGDEFEHAELQLLDYIETTIFSTGGVSGTLPLYIGVSLRCCGKCHTVINFYNSWGFNHVRVVTRGIHPTYDFSGWRCPKGLLRRIAQTNPSFVDVVEALTLTSQGAKKEHPMTADLSDSEEEEYVPRKHRI